MFNYAATTSNSMVPVGAQKKQKTDSNPDSKGSDSQGNSDDLSSLENILRQQKIKDMSQAGNTPTQQQQKDIDRFAPQDGLVHKYEGELGNYSRLTAQMNRLNYDVVRAMDVSTLENSSQMFRLDHLNNSQVGMMLASQHGVLHASKKAVKKVTKGHKLSSQDTWI